MYVLKILGPQGAVVTATLIALLVSAISDARHRTLPVILYPLLLVLSAVLGVGAFSSAPRQYVLAGVIFGLLFLLQAMFFDGGGGDVILMLVMGLIYGLAPMLVMVFVSAFAVVVWYAVAAAARKARLNMRMTFPYAPFLTMGFLFYLWLEHMGGM